MPITKIQTSGIPDLAVTHDKLHTDMDLSTKTVTLPALSQSLTIDRASSNGTPVVDLYTNKSQGEFSKLRFYNQAYSGSVPMATISAQVPTANVYGRLDFKVNSANVDETVMSLYEGKVGIGTDSPAQKLHIYGNTPQILLDTSDYRGQIWSIRSTNGAPNNTGTLSFRDEAGNNWLDLAANEGAPITRFYSGASSARMVIRNDGNVGIGTTNPQAKLHVTSSVLIEGGSTDSRTLGFTNASGSTGWSIGNGIIDSTHNFRIYDNTAGAARFTVDGNGNVGIGTSNPTVSLEVNNASARIKLSDGTDQVNIGLWDGSNYRIEGDANRPIFITSYDTDNGVNIGSSGSTHFSVRNQYVMAYRDKSGGGSLKQFSNGAVDLFPTLGKYLGYIASGQSASIASLVGNTANNGSDTGTYMVMLKGANTALGIYMVTIGTATDIYDGGIYVAEQFNDRGRNQVAAGFSAADHIFITVTTLMKSNGHCYGTCHTMDMDQYGNITTGGAYPGGQIWAIHLHGGNKGEKTLWSA
jgi:hypothetical protein